MKWITWIALCALVANAWSQDWPTNDEQLLFLFQDANEEIFAFLPGEDEPLFDYAFKKEGFAQVNRVGALLPAQGRFIAPNQGKTFRQAMKTAAGFTLSFYMIPGNNLTQTTIPIQLGEDLMIQIKDETLHAKVRSDAGLMTLSKALPKNKAVHVSFRGSEKGTALFFGDTQVAASKEPVKGFGSWKSGELTFGNGSFGKTGFDGSLEAIAFFTDALSDGDIKADVKAYADIINKRKPSRSMTLKAKITKKSHLPATKEISPYTESLAVFEYEIQSISEGASFLKNIRIAHWTILGGKYVPLRDKPIGTIVEMTIEPFADNRQLKTVNISDTLPVDATATLWFDASGAALK